MQVATAEWADPELVGTQYAYREGTVWLGRSSFEVPLGYIDDRHVCLVSGSRGGKGASFIVPALIEWPGSCVTVDPKGENATITAARRGGGSKNATGLGQAVRVLDPFKTAVVDDSVRGRFNPLDALDPDQEETVDEAGRIADAIVVVHEESKDPFWDESARAMVKGLILHILTAPEYEGRRNLITLRKLVLRGDWESVEYLRSQRVPEDQISSAQALLWKMVASNDAFGGLVAGIGESFSNMLRHGAKQHESVMQIVNRNTEFLDSPGMQRCLESSDFTLSELKTRPEGLSLYLCLPQRFMNTHYRWLRMMIALTVTEMEKVRGRPVTGHPVLMVLDEFAGLKRMEVIENAVAQIAGFGVKLLFVLQSLEQLKAVYKDNWETFLANSGLKVFFNLEDHFSREYVSKLIGETELIREVKSASDSQSESESYSQSITRSQSETRGRSSSAGTSVTDGTNDSVSSGRNRGTSKSKGRGVSWGQSENRNYISGLFGKNYDRQRNEGKNESKSISWNTTESEGQSTGESHGTSQSTGRSQTEGTSESWTKGVSETEGRTRGTSKSTTAGTSETIQKRALVTPDEIGQLFSRVDDRAHDTYPGLALAVVSGARPVPLRRVNYYEDYQFIRTFDPHPDHPFTAPKELAVEGRAAGLHLADFGLGIVGWSIRPGQIVPVNYPAVAVGHQNGEALAHVRVPHAGVVKETSQNGIGGDLPDGRLFSLWHYEDGSERVDPFAELRAVCDQMRARLETKRPQERKLLSGPSTWSRKSWIAGIAACAVAATVGFIVMMTRSEITDSGSHIAPIVDGPKSPPPTPREEHAPAPAPQPNRLDQAQRSAVEPQASPNQNENRDQRAAEEEVAPAGRGVSIDLSALMSSAMGISQGYTQQQVAGLYRTVSVRTLPDYPDYATGRYDGGLEIAYKSNRTTDLTILSRTLSAKEPLADLVGRTEDEARSMVRDSPMRVPETTSTGAEFVLCWYFPNYPGRPEETFCPVRRTLAVDFKRGAGGVPRVSAVHVNWGDW